MKLSAVSDTPPYLTASMLEEVAELISVRVVALLRDEGLLPTDRMPVILTAQDVSEYLRVPLTTLYKWRSQGIGPTGRRIGRHLTYRREDVDAWYEGQSS